MSRSKAIGLLMKSVIGDSLVQDITDVDGNGIGENCAGGALEEAAFVGSRD